MKWLLTWYQEARRKNPATTWLVAYIQMNLNGTLALKATNYNAEK